MVMTEAYFQAAHYQQEHMADPWRGMLKTHPFNATTRRWTELGASLSAKFRRFLRHRQRRAHRSGQGEWYEVWAPADWQRLKWTRCTM